MSVSDGDMEKEILPFLDRNARADLKEAAIQHFLGLTGTSDGRAFIGRSDKLLQAVVKLAMDTNHHVSKQAVLCLVNLSADDDIATRLMESNWCEEIISHFLSGAVDAENEQADVLCSVLSNLTRSPLCAHRLSAEVLDKIGLTKIVEVLCKPNFNKHADLRYLATFLMNMTQVPAVRHALVARPKGLLQQLLPDAHEWLLSGEVDLLLLLLLPLAGADDLEEDEMELLPPDLQYLPETHTRDPDPEIRQMLVQALTKLCSTRAGRLHLKERNVYIIIRELHKWEKEEGNIPSILNLIDILVGDEPEEGMEDLHKVEVPAHFEKKFEEEQLL